ncbi:MAG: cyclic nucleotide-binding domain-containing protein, partial [Candidatus Brocadiales bacterium]|nr:cyclic nucleotide-binding domain-containing protein [Candidatus Brocadiales bacterium]
GLTSVEEITATGISEEKAKEMMRLKLKFAFGAFRPTSDLLEHRIVKEEQVEIRNGVYITRLDSNEYEFRYKEETVTVNLNLKSQEMYEAPYELGFHQIDREYFAVIHSGEGDGWDINRPCMASVIMFHGKIYLIDAGPNVLDSLIALRIDSSEIEGIFHTHNHDDHFAGLPTLMKTDHRIKYYSTPLVRASVEQKFAALMSIEARHFSQYFDIHHLDFNQWNDIDGLLVKPLFSPHPVETNILLFKALGENGYQTYAHWADITSFGVLGKMITDKPEEPGISNDFYESVKSIYLTQTDLKKIDIGGGLIHGKAEDFEDDHSEKIILAHTALKLTKQQKEIGSQASFGNVDVMIPTHQNYLRQKASKFLKEYFPGISEYRLQPLLNSPVVSFNPGTTILKRNLMNQYVYLVLVGTIEYIQSDLDVKNDLFTGCMVGETSVFKGTPSPGTYRTITHIKALRFSVELFRVFLEENGLFDHLNIIQDNIGFLKKTWLFGEDISYLVQNRFAQNMVSQSYDKGQQLHIQESPGVYLLKEGEITISFQNDVVDVLSSGDFCGENMLLGKGDNIFLTHATQSSVVYFITNTDNSLLKVPAVHWKLLEVFARRSTILEA